ncbi:hypothetical protein [Sphingomonas oligoaromativorans]|uniref:hypothetical protein n=1 Tax=Sphingomonas oligoaromativorans TaxID=575322 RepID=UPI001423D07A|nr:hypothetical protein [Sphingomonas oligoaromativorans]NIJ31797.1 hypothetical protein [Sphingomonas oligoaromativorans]
MKAVAIRRAEELDRGYGAGGGIEEGIVRVKAAAEAQQIQDAQSWLSAIFILVRRLRRTPAVD